MGHSINNRPVTARARDSQSCNLEGNNRPVTARARNPQSCNLEGNNRRGTAGARNPRSCNLEGSSQDLPRSTKLDYLRRGILLTFRRTSQIFGPSSSSTNNTSTSLCGFENSQTSGVRRDEEELRVGQALDLDAANLRVFTLPELRTATKNFSADTVIGDGGFGKIYKGWIKEKTATKRGSKLPIAVKKLNPESVQGVEEWQTEVNILGRLSHPNIIKLLGFAQEDSELLLVYEFMPRGSLDNHLFGSANVQPLSWDTRLKVMIGVARALSFLHSLEEKIIFRDVKTSNILLDKTYTAKLSDFGLAKYGPAVDHSHATQLMGTHGYAAPEYMATGHLYVKSDVYGFGIVVMEMLTGKRISDIISKLCQKKPLIHWFKSNLLNGEKMRSTMDAKLEGKYPSKLALQLARLTLKCILDDPKVRPSMKEVVEKLEKIEAANEKVAH